MSSNGETAADYSRTEDNNQILLQTRDLSLVTGGRELLSDITLTVSAGEIVTVIGPNGTGKRPCFVCYLD